MQEIKCPECGKVFQVDESGYAQILKQVRDHEFEKELSEREESDLAIARMEQEKAFSQELTKKQNELSDKDRQILELKSQLDKAETEKELAVTKATQEKDKELSEKDNEIIKLKGDLDLQKKEGELEKNNLVEKHRNEIILRDEEIVRLKEYKESLKTKMVGEDLEQHCMNQFNQIRMTAFPNAYFEKDNDASSGSKGDFIFRDYVDGTEFISIMFDMKNEQDSTKTKHKNEDFFKELDKDRTEKKCEYAVLVSMLERDNEYYNNGIVDVSYRYDKMYVIRPQFFIPLISLLRNAALNSLEYQKKLAEVQSQQIDLYNFEDNLSAFKNDFSVSVLNAEKNYNKAIEDIDKAISNLQDVRDKLEKSMKNLNTANNKLDKVNIKKLTKNAPSVKAMFDEIKEAENITSEDTSS
ncbi:MAG: DUF2130 domain-containing protein [Clostridiales bacterium]|nr:DUF2130 domain-containing protein [Clostridiales bacterium]